MPFNDTRAVRGGLSIPSFKFERMIAEGKLERLSDGQVQKTRYRTSEFRDFPNFFEEEGARFDVEPDGANRVVLIPAEQEDTPRRRKTYIVQRRGPPREHLTLPDDGDWRDATPTERLAGLFGIERVRPGQTAVFSSLAAGKHVLGVMPTGSGKSLTFQEGAYRTRGVTLVLSPTISLMQDQHRRLTDLGVPAVAVHSMNRLTYGEERMLLSESKTGRLRIVFASPERLRFEDTFTRQLEGRVGLLVVDEAHCIALQGHAFRPDYLRIRHYRERLGDPQVLALTATATPAIRAEILSRLDIEGADVIDVGFARPELHFAVRHFAGTLDKEAALLEFLEAQSPSGAGIVYTITRGETESLAEIATAAGFPAEAYHGELEPAARQRTQDRFMAGELDLVFATNAFGMGLDRQDVRWVLHYSAPRSLEAYAQEAGRAARDGGPAHCQLWFCAAEHRRLHRLLDREMEALHHFSVFHGLLCRYAPDGLLDRDTLAPELADYDQITRRVMMALLEEVGALRIVERIGRSTLVELGELGPQQARRIEEALELVESAKRQRLSEMEAYAMLSDGHGDHLARYFGQGRA